MPSSSPARLTLIIPELLWPEPADEIAWRGLADSHAGWLIARGRATEAPARAFELALAACFGLDDPALARFRRLGEADLPTLAADERWLCADPVHLRFHHERIVLADAGAFEIERREADALAADLNREFADIGEFVVTDPRRWYLRLKATVDHRSAPISTVAGRRVASDLPADTAGLTRWLNEVQMFLHLHPVNEGRQRAGQPAINSLWLWGAGQEQTPSPHFDRVWSGQELATGLARAVGIPCAPLPDPTEIVRHTRAGERQLLVLDSLLPPVLYENSEDWHQAWQTLDRTWFAMLRSHLGADLPTVDLVAPTIFGELRWQLAGRDRWKFWAGRQDIAGLARSLAGAPQGERAAGA